MYDRIIYFVLKRVFKISTSEKLYHDFIDVISGIVKVPQNSGDETWSGSPQFEIMALSINYQCE